MQQLEALLADFHDPLRSISAIKLRQLVETNPDFIPGLGSLAWHELSMRHFSEAARLYQHIIDLEPGIEQAHLLLASCQQALAELAELQDSPVLSGNRRKEICSKAIQLCQYNDSRPPMEFPVPWEVKAPFWSHATLLLLLDRQSHNAEKALFLTNLSHEPLTAWEKRFLKGVQAVSHFPMGPFGEKLVNGLLEMAFQHYQAHPVMERPPWGLFWCLSLPWANVNGILKAAHHFRNLRSRAFPYFSLERCLLLEAHRHSPQHPDVLKGLILAALDEENLPEAKGWCQALIDASPSSSWGYLAHGSALSFLREWDLARAAYESASRAGLDDTEILFHSGLVSVALGETKPASEILGRVRGSLANEVKAAFISHTLKAPPPQTLLECSVFIEKASEHLGAREDLLEASTTRRVPVDEGVPVHACPICCGDQVRTAGAFGHNQAQVAFCSQCDFYHINPQAANHSTMHRYSSGYLDGMYLRIVEWCRSSEGTEDGLYGLYHNTFRWLEADPRVDFRNLPGGAALDVGCAVGAMVKILKRRGWNAIGVEPSVPLSELARSEHIEVQTGFLEDLEYDSGAFDLVTLMHVLEHVPHPSALVHEIARITSPGGHLLLSLPIAGTLRHYVQGAAYFDQPDHVSFFTPANIYRLLDAAGFDVIAFETPEDVVHAFDQLRQGNLPWHPVLVDRMVGWRQGSILDVFARKRKSIE